MAVVQKGIGVVWGISSTIPKVGTGVRRITTETMSRGADQAEFRDPATGDVDGKVFYNQRDELQLDVLPKSAASTPTIAQAVSEISLPTIGDLVVVTDATHSDIDGNYLALSASKVPSSEGGMIISMTLEKYTANDITTTIS